MYSDQTPPSSSAQLSSSPPAYQPPASLPEQTRRPRGSRGKGHERDKEPPPHLQGQALGGSEAEAVPSKPATTSATGAAATAPPLPPPTAPLAMRIQQEATTANKSLAASVSPPTLLSIRGAASHPPPSVTTPAPAPAHHPAATHLAPLPPSQVTPAPRERDTATSRWASSPTVSPVAAPPVTSSTSPLPPSVIPPATSTPQPQGLGMNFLRDEGAQSRTPEAPNAMGQIEAVLAKLRTSASSHPTPAPRASAPPTILRSTPVAAPQPPTRVAPPPSTSTSNPLLARISEPKQPALGGRSRWDYDGENVEEVPVPDRKSVV